MLPEFKGDGGVEGTYAHVTNLVCACHVYIGSSDPESLHRYTGAAPWSYIHYLDNASNVAASMLKVSTSLRTLRRTYIYYVVRM